MTGLAWSDVAIMALGALVAIALMVLIETVRTTRKARRYADARRRWRHVCGVCHTTTCTHPEA